MRPNLSASDQPASVKAQREQVHVRWMTMLFFAGLIAILCQPLLSSASWMTFLQDDCFYYLKVAQSIAGGHGSTFNGITPTNGYQPLWLWTLTGLSLLTTSPKMILTFFACSNLVAAVATFLLSRRLISLSGIRPLVSFSLAALVTLYALMLFFYGMETTLTVPIMLGVISLAMTPGKLLSSFWRAAGFGLLLSAMVLSRIDTLIFIALGALCFAISRFRHEISTKGVLAIGLGFLPVPLYFLINHQLFGTWLPVSGVAKQLRQTHVPSLEPWKVFFHPLATGYALIIVLALVLWPRVRHIMPATWLFPAVLLFPFTYYFVLSCVSDWTLWGWYMYPLRTALCVSIVIFCTWLPTARLLARTPVAWLLVIAAFGGLALTRWRRQQEDIDAASVEIAQFAESHPGTYAMGDRAGRVGFRMHSPLVQTEGLMMDKAFLSDVRQQAPLREVLRKHQVSYYVATAYEPFKGCFRAVEPAKAGPTSDRMRSTFCEPALATWTHDGIQTLVFDVRR